MRRVPLMELRKQLGKKLHLVVYKDEVLVITNKGEDYVAVLPLKLVPKSLLKDPAPKNGRQAKNSRNRKA